MPEEIEVPVLFKTPAAPDGSIAGISRFSNIFGAAYRSIATHPFVLGAIALFHVMKDSVLRYKGHEEAVNSLKQTMLNRGIYSRALTEQYREMAASIQSTTLFSEEELTQAEAQLQANIGDLPVTKDLLRAVTDLAAAKGMDLASAADMVGKAIGSTMNPLARQGIVLSDNLSRAERMVAVVRGIEGKWKGQAEAQVKGLGALKLMQNSFIRLQVSFGQRLAPYVVMAAREAKALAEALTESTVFLDGISYVFEHLTIGVTFLKTTMSVVAGSLTTMLQSSFRSMTKAFEGNIVGAMEELRTGASRAHADNIRKLKSFAADGEAMLAARRDQRREAADRQIQMLNESSQSRRRNGTTSQAELDAMFKTRTEKDAIETITYQRLRSDARIRLINQKISKEQNKTERLALEREKRKIIDIELKKTSQEFEEKKYLFGFAGDKASFDLQKSVLQNLSELRNSKIAPLVIIGKGAAISAITYNISIAIPTTMEALSFIPPPAGQVLGATMSTLLALYAAEQIENIIDSSLDNPGRIGMGLKFSLNAMEALIKGAVHAITHGYEMIAKTVGEGIKAIIGGEVGEQIAEALEEAGEIADLITYGIAIEATKALLKGVGVLTQGLARGFEAVGKGLRNASEEVKKAIGSVAGAVASVLPGPIGDAFLAVGDFVGGTVGWVGDFLGDVQEAIGSVISAIGDAIGSIVGTVGGWLGLAEGGLITHAAGMSQVVPLRKSGLRFRSEVTVTIQGGLIPSPREVVRIASLIDRELRRA